MLASASAKDAPCPVSRHGECNPMTRDHEGKRVDRNNSPLASGMKLTKMFTYEYEGERYGGVLCEASKGSTGNGGLYSRNFGEGHNPCCWVKYHTDKDGNRMPTEGICVTPAEWEEKQKKRQDKGNNWHTVFDEKDNGVHVDLPQFRFGSHGGYLAVLDPHEKYTKTAMCPANEDPKSCPICSPASKLMSDPYTGVQKYFDFGTEVNAVSTKKLSHYILDGDSDYYISHTRTITDDKTFYCNQCDDPTDETPCKCHSCQNGGTATGTDGNCGCECRAPSGDQVRLGGNFVGLSCETATKTISWAEYHALNPTPNGQNCAKDYECDSKFCSGYKCRERRIKSLRFKSLIRKN